MSIESLLHPPIDPPPPVKQYRCPVEGCDKVYTTHLGLQGHSIAHKPPVNCPECGKAYKSPGALGNHRKNIHGLLSNVQQEALRKGEQITLPNVVLDWKADDIFQSILTLLWPSGVVPIHAIVPLIQWREDTQQFLEKIR